MRRPIARSSGARSIGALAAMSLATLIAQSPARAGGDITNFNVRNCATERIFVCSFDKTDSLMKVPYDARGIQPGDRKEFGCASLKKCKVIIGVSKRKSKSTLSSGMKAAIATGSVAAAGIAGVTGVGAGVVAGSATGTMYIGSEVLTSTAVATSTVTTLTAAAATAGFVAVAAGGTVAALEISDGWSDGEVCNQVKKAAQKAGLKPKTFLDDGKKYTVVERYAVDKDGNPYLNPDGTAVLAYIAEKGNTCPASLKTQIVPK